MKKFFCFLTVLLLTTTSLYAHEHRTIANQYEFVVGFVNEPAFSGQMNGIDLRVSKDGQPVEGLEATLKTAVRYGNETESFELPLKTRYKQPGAYASYFLPTKPGKYIFEISGTLGGTSIKEVFESGPQFHDVEDSEALRWPKK